MSNEQKKLPDIIQTVSIDAPIQKVWDYVSTAEGIAEWFMPSDFKLQVGHEFTIQSPFGPSPCKVLEVEEPTKISIQWDTDGWELTFLLRDMGSETEFTVIHGGWKEEGAIVPKAQRPQSAIRDTMNQGWAGIVQKLKQLVEA
ncbi:SRPBCC domain-containing protein [Lysinibacillus sp. SGAir0095]|uniref:SRPBCC family protein n=1 Tax=Lysinibacillus sp. SGAir0095 TaxID=2070463 RepID=UPI0010CD279E|nr:SRPBCC domain-containing protein [Lysinibacillus sp. SGAir0095]QCR34099.1 SRPBCC domain-containing protein [Lysinibacillus sp. SGAir0095]